MLSQEVSCEASLMLDRKDSCGKSCKKSYSKENEATDFHTLRSSKKRDLWFPVHQEWCGEPRQSISHILQQ